jgi:hypothetical protein
MEVSKITNREGAYVVKAWSDRRHRQEVLYATDDTLGEAVKQAMGIEEEEETLNF